MGGGDRPTRVSRNTDDDVVDAVPGRRDDPSVASWSSSSSTTTTTGVSMRWITRDGHHPLDSRPVDNDVMPASSGTTRAAAVASAVAGRHRRRLDGRRRRRRPPVVVRPRPRRSIGIGGRRCRGRGGFPPRGAICSSSCTSLFGRTSPYALFNFQQGKTCGFKASNMNSSFKLHKNISHT